MKVSWGRIVTNTDVTGKEVKTVRGILRAALVLMAFILTASTLTASGMARGRFDEYGFNYGARIFNGIYENWFRREIGEPPWQKGEPYLCSRGSAHVVSKWDELYAAAWYGPDNIIDSGDEAFWVSGASRFWEFKWDGSATEPKGNLLLQILVAPLQEPPSPDAEDLKWGYPIAEDGTVLCFWCIFEVIAAYCTGPVIGPAHPNGLGAYK